MSSAVIRSLLAITACLLACAALAQDARAQDPRVLSEAEVKAKYQDCPNGYYSGPRPGKARYTKDNFIWAVTPEFARKFCMPPEFVSNELKGAEAVAFRVVEDADEERCGWGGRAEVCSRMKELRFEIYFDASVKLPKKNDLKLSAWPKRPSALLITQKAEVVQRRHQESQIRPPDQASRVFPAFETSQFGLDGFKDGKVIWPIVGLYEYIWNEGIFEGINYLALQGSTGFFTNPRMEKLDVRRFAIVVNHLDDKKQTNRDRSLAEFAHVIELPESFSDKVRAADKARGTNVEELGKRAFGIKQ